MNKAVSDISVLKRTEKQTKNINIFIIVDSISQTDSGDKSFEEIATALSSFHSSSKRG